MHHRLIVVLTVAAAAAASVTAALPAQAASTGRPTITAVRPATGPVSGGSHVRLVGTNLRNIKRVSFDGTSAAVFAVSGTGRAITVTAPASAAPRTVDITVRTASGSTTSRNAFRYLTGWSASWHAPQTIADPVDSPRVLSCPTTHCYGMDLYGNVLDSGSTGGDWVDHGRPGDDTAFDAREACSNELGECAGLSCPTLGWCLAVDSHGAPQIWSGGTWQAYPTLNVDGAHTFDHTPVLSCASTTFCMVQDAGGSYSTFDGTNWAPVRSLYNNQVITSAAQIESLAQFGTTIAVSCAGAECMMVAGAVAYRYSAGSWADTGEWVSRDGDITQVDLQNVSCANTAATGTQLLCAAAGLGTIVYSAGSWGHVSYRAVTTSCRSDGRCVGFTGGLGTWQATVWGDPTLTTDKYGWSTYVPGPATGKAGQVLAAACESNSTCLATYANGLSATFDLDTQHWSKVRSILAPDTGITDLSCTMTTTAQRYCLAGTGGPDLVTDRGTGWTAPTEVFDRGERTAAVSCVDRTTFCMAIANNNRLFSKANHYAVYRNGTVTTRSMVTGTYRTVSCWSPRGCYALSASRVLRWNGSVWSLAVNLAKRHLKVVDLTCVAGDQACLAVTFGDRSFWINGTRISALVPMNGNRASLHPVAVACQSVHKCIATTNDPAANPARGALYSDTRADWLSQGYLDPRGDDYGRAVACAPDPVDTACLALGDGEFGHYATEYDGAVHDAPEADSDQRPALIDRTSVTCPSTSACYVGDAIGRIRAYS